MPGALPNIRSRTLVVLFAVGLAVQAGALWLRGTGDVGVFKVWAVTALDRGVPQTYALNLRLFMPDAAPDYPPLSVYLLEGVARVAHWVAPDLRTDSRTLTLFVKAPILMLRLAVFLLLLGGVRRLTGSRDLARLAALAYWLNPAFVLDGPALGYLDPLCWMPGVVAVIAAANEWAGTAGLLAAVSVLIKPQGLFFFVPVAAALWPRRAALSRAALVAAGAIALATVPILLSTPRGFVTSMTVNFTEDMLSGDAMNLWWIVAALGLVWNNGWRATVQAPLAPVSLVLFSQYAGLNPRPWAAAFVLMVAAYLAWQVRGRTSVAIQSALCALVVHVYFVFAISVHENHLVYALPFIGLTALLDRSYRRLYLATSAFVTMNLGLFYGLGRDFTQPSRVGLFLPLTVAGSLAGIALLAWHVRLFRSLVARTPALLDSPD